MTILRVDARFGMEERERSLNIEGGRGIRFCDGDEPMLTIDARPLLAALLEIASTSPGVFGEWAKKCRASMPGSG